MGEGTKQLIPLRKSYILLREPDTPPAAGRLILTAAAVGHAGMSEELLYGGMNTDKR